jgi:tetratricopeptide (TPR) repeat protein
MEQQEGFVNSTSQMPPRSQSGKRRAFVLLLLLALAGGGAFWWFRIRDVPNREHALELAWEGRFAEAEPLLKRLLDRSPNDLEVIQALAQGHARAGNEAKEQEYLDRWCELRPEEAEPLKFRMELHQRQRNFDKALADGLRLLKLDPADLGTRERVAGLYLFLGDLRAAEEQCLACLKQSPRSRPARFLLADIRRAESNTAEAAALLDQLLQENPSSSQALMSRATLFSETGEPLKAIPLLRKVLEIDPGRQRTGRYQLSMALERAGQSDEARRVMAELRRMQDAEVLKFDSDLQPENLVLRVQAAEALLANGDHAEGLKRLQDVLRKEPDYRPAHQALAAFYEGQGQQEKAAAHRRRAGQKP